jgi:hypothetical protein
MRFALRSYDGSDWQTYEWLPHGSGEAKVEVASDGTVWVGNGYAFAGDDPDRNLGMLNTDGWQSFDDEEGHLSLLDDTTAVHVDVSVDGAEAGKARLVARRFDGGAWHDWRTAMLDEDPCSDIGSFAGYGATVGPDGTIWAVANPLKRSNSRWPAYSTHVVRIDADGVREWHPDDGVPDIHLGSLYVAPDGSLWGTWSDLEGAEGVPAAHDNGVARFDGETWGHFLLGHYVLDMDIGPDGLVWVLTQHHEERDSVSLHVITPDAMAGNE